MNPDNLLAKTENLVFIVIKLILVLCLIDPKDFTAQD